MRFFTRRSLGRWLAPLGLLFAGCSIAPLHGYEVAHSAMDLEHRAVPVAQETRSVGPEDHASDRFEQLLQHSLLQHRLHPHDRHLRAAEDFRLAPPSAEDVRVRLLDGGNADRNGALSSRLRIELPADGHHHGTMTLRGPAFRERVSAPRFHW